MRRLLGRGKREYPGGEKAQESYAPDSSLNRFVWWRTLAMSKALKAGCKPNVMRAAASETAYGFAGGTMLWRVNPMGGTGME